MTKPNYRDLLTRLARRLDQLIRLLGDPLGADRSSVSTDDRAQQLCERFGATFGASTMPVSFGSGQSSSPFHLQLSSPTEMFHQTVLHPSAFKSVLQILESELHLPAQFLCDLRFEDDWSFVIKAHALVEAAKSHQLSEALLDSRLMPIFRQLPLGETDYGKLKFARELGLLLRSRC